MQTTSLDHGQLTVSHDLADPRPDRHVYRRRQEPSNGAMPFLALCTAGFAVGGTCFLISPDTAADLMAATIAPVGLSFAFFRSRN